MTFRGSSVVLCGFVLAVMGPLGIASSDPVRSTAQMGQERRIELVIRNNEFVLTQPAPIRLGAPTVIILRNQDIVRHGFTSPILPQLSVSGEGQGVSAYGRGIEGFYVDPDKTLVIRFTNNAPGNYTFKCDLHPDMKGELFTLDVPAA